MSLETEAFEEARKKKVDAMLASLAARGFDITTYDEDEDHYNVRCSQCAAAVINGVPCHETGCPNAAVSRI